jgi:hypothetical protein
MLSENITIDKLIYDIDQQIEILTAIANDNAILAEQLRLLLESREMILSQQLETERLADLIGPDNLTDHSTMIDRYRDPGES